MRFLALFCIYLLMLSSEMTGGKENDCSKMLACQPWDKNKACSRNELMDLRFGVQNHASGEMAAFGLCPVVDQVQAFEFTGIGSLLGGLLSDNYATFFVYGQGPMYQPTEDYSNSVLYAKEAPECGQDRLAVVDFLLLKISMSSGVYAYESNVTFPHDTGFVPTCSWLGGCFHSSADICIGRDGEKNCARCVPKEMLDSVRTTVWVSYYGSDRYGAEFTSGAHNPQGA
uniref:Uncharacterized protein n=1 Tax=Trypanosoma vivax (strain Y486) TaxID=1055687 RepID=G0TX87_TRYVY|nr:conserved hypothetical protein [Trypanosoma vivax Y486]